MRRRTEESCRGLSFRYWPSAQGSAFIYAILALAFYVCERGTNVAPSMISIPERQLYV